MLAEAAPVGINNVDGSMLPTLLLFPISIDLCFVSKRCWSIKSCRADISDYSVAALASRCALKILCRLKQINRFTSCCSYWSLSRDKWIQTRFCPPISGLDPFSRVVPILTYADLSQIVLEREDLQKKTTIEILRIHVCCVVIITNNSYLAIIICSLF